MSLQRGRILKILVPVINNNWVVGLSFLIFSSYYGIQNLNFRSILNKISPYLKPIVESLVYFALLLFLTSIIIRLHRLYKNWKLVHFKDQSFILSFDPILKFVNFLKRKHFDILHIKLIIDKFQNRTNSNYYTLVESSQFRKTNLDTWQIKEIPTIVYKIPIRNHVALSDFQDLRLLRHVVAAGGRVIVIILDIPFLDKQSPKIDIDQCYVKTHSMIKRVLGSSVVIQRLSTICSEEMNMFIRFLFYTYIPLYADKFDRKIFINNSGIDDKVLKNISYLVFGILLYALNYIYIKNKVTSFIIIQWKERLFKWEEFAEFIKEKFEMKILGLIVGENFLNYKGEKLRTSISNFEDLSFTLNESNVSVAKKILSFDSSCSQMAWKIPDDYIEYLAENILGIEIKGKIVDEKILRKHYKRLKNFYSRYTENVNDISLYDKERLKSLYIRYKFHKEFSKIQRVFLKY